MLKVFLVLYVGTGIGGTWGPVGQLDACEDLARARQMTIDDVVASGKTQSGMRVTVAQRTALRAWKFKCVVADERPKVGDDV